jgi:MFS family permease
MTTLQAPTLASTSQRGRWAVTAAFLLNGVLLASYIVRLPALKVDLALSTVQLGIVSTGFGLAALITVQFLGRLVARFGSRPLIRVALVAMPLALVGLGAAPGFGGLVLAAAAFGVSHGTLDVSMNAHAVAVERRLERPVMIGCHAAWSVGAATASLAGGGLIAAGASTVMHFLVVGAVVVVAGALTGSRLLPAATDRHAASEAASTTPVRVGWRSGWSRAVVLLGIAGIGLIICDNAAITWSGVFLHDDRGASLTLASFAVTAYTASQMVGRLFGDRLIVRYGEARLFRAGGLVGVAGYLLAVLGPHPVAAAVGFGIIGGGLSFLIPLTYRAAGHAGGSGPGAAAFVARFTTFTYGGILFGPLIIGWAAEAVTLQWTLLAMVPLLALVALLTRLPARAET